MKTMRSVLFKLLLICGCLFGCNKNTPTARITILPAKTEGISYPKANDMISHSADYGETALRMALQTLAPAALAEGLFADSLSKCAQDSMAAARVRGACFLLLTQNPQVDTNPGLRAAIAQSMEKIVSTRDIVLLRAAAVALLAQPLLLPLLSAEQISGLPQDETPLFYALYRAKNAAYPYKLRPSQMPWEQYLRENSSPRRDCDGENTWWKQSACWRSLAAQVVGAPPYNSLSIPATEPNAGLQAFHKLSPYLASRIFSNKEGE